MSFGDNAALVKISARALLELLAGKMRPSEFIERYNFIRSGSIGLTENPFEIIFRRGLSIDDVSIEKSGYNDDDWIILKLRGPDPAISPFVIPKSNTD